jgi:hypothetical protein
MAPSDERAPSGSSSTSNLAFLASPVVLAFVGGMVSSSVVWYSIGRMLRGEGGGGEKDTTFSWVSMNDFKHRIGELPGLPRRAHWPWDRRRSSSNITTSDSTAKGRKESTQERSQLGTSPASSTTTTHLKSDLCIGSIFGLDVGGSLGKLVYFEQESSTIESTTETSSMMGRQHSRQRAYRTAASAQAVLLARRGLVRLNSAEETADHGHHRNYVLHRQRSHSQENLSCSYRQLRKNPEQQQRRSSVTEASSSPSLTKPELHHSALSDEDVQNLHRLRQECLCRNPSLLA